MVDKHCEHQVRKAHHSDTLKASLVSRLNRIEGQVRGAKRMIEADTYCDEVLNLIASIQSALAGVSNLLVEHHIKSCVTEQIQAGDLAVIDELMKTIKKITK